MRPYTPATCSHSPSVRAIASSTSSPLALPYSSLMILKRSMSNWMTANSSSGCAARSSAVLRQKAVRLYSPVSRSCSATCRSSWARRAARSSVSRRAAWRRSRSSTCFTTMLSTRLRATTGLKGFAMKSSAPQVSAVSSWAVSQVSTMTGMSARSGSAFMASSTANPSMPSMPMSSTTMSTLPRASTSSDSRPPLAWSTLYDPANRFASSVRSTLESSTMSMVRGASTGGHFLESSANRMQRADSRRRARFFTHPL